MVFPYINLGPQSGPQSGVAGIRPERIQNYRLPLAAFGDRRFLTGRFRITIQSRSGLVEIRSRAYPKLSVYIGGVWGPKVFISGL